MNKRSYDVDVVALKIFDQLVDDKAVNVDLDGVKYPIRRDFGGKQGNIPGVDIGTYRYIMQNPNTKSQYAIKAQQGHKIMWVINTDPKIVQGDRWVARVEDGECFISEKTGTYSSTWTKVAKAHIAATMTIAPTIQSLAKSYGKGGV